MYTVYANICTSSMGTKEVKLSKLQIYRRKIERKLISKRRHRSGNENIPSKTNINDVAATATYAKWSWGDHVIKTDPLKWTHAITVRAQSRKKECRKTGNGGVMLVRAK